MPDTIYCDTHGETEKAYVCNHLKGDSSGLGFHCEDPSEENPYPDAWCDACESIRATHGGWDPVPKGLCKIVVLCSGCYGRCRILNTQPTVTLDELANLRWKCSDCDEWHYGPCLDFGYWKPFYWGEAQEQDNQQNHLSPADDSTPKTFLTEDYCSIDGENFFVRGVIHLPIIGTNESFGWGVWGSLSRDNFEKLRRTEHDPECVNLPPMFSWLSSQIADYPDTLSLKMFAHIQPPGTRPHFWLEPSEHALALEYHHGITPERVKEIMLRRLPVLES